MDSEQLADLDTIGLDVGLGKWPNASVATAIREAGVMGFGAVGTSKASIIFQAVAVDPLPQKPWEELKPLLQEAYFAKKATDEAIEKNNAIKDAMLRLAKEQMKEFVKETESSRQARIDEQVADWEAEVSAEVAKAQKMLQTPNLGPKRVNVWKIGRTSALMSLPGHSSAVDALTFDRTEETLVAGCSGGSLKIWSLEAQKVLPATCSRYSYFEPGTLQTAKIARFLK